MTHGFGMRWPVCHKHEVLPEDVDPLGGIRRDVVVGWISAACSEYLQRCRALTLLAERSDLTVAFDVGELPNIQRLGRPESVLVSASVPEVSATSFTLGVRLRPRGGDDAGDVVETRCIVRLASGASGAAAELTTAVRRELVALERDARHHN